MPQIIFWKNPRTGTRQVLDILNTIAEKSMEERQKKNFVNDYQTLDTAIKYGLDFLVKSATIREEKGLEMPIMQPSFKVTIQVLFERLKSPENEVCVFRINHETLTAFRIVFFIYHKKGKTYYVATHALFKRGKSTKEYDEAIKRCDQIAENYKRGVGL